MWLFWLSTPRCGGADAIALHEMHVAVARRTILFLESIVNLDRR